MMSAGLVLMTAPAASAHVATITGSASCTTSGWDATFTVTNDNGYGDATLTGTGTGLDGSYAQGAPKSITVHKASADASATVSGGSMAWSNYTQANISKTVDRPGNCSTDEGKKVVVCKYVGTPPGTPDHIIVVSSSAIKDFPGTFPWTFADAHDSVAIRYAVGNEQPGNEELVNCPGYQPPPTSVTPAAPSATDATCSAPGHLVLPSSTEYHWTGDTADTPGTHVVTAVATGNHTLTGQTTFTVKVPAKGQGDDLDCRDVVLPIAPTVTQSHCTGPGTSSTPSVDTAHGPSGVSYVYNSSTHVVTATADHESRVPHSLPAGWTWVSGTSATYQVTFTNPGSCLVDKPVGAAPSATDATCAAPGHLVLPTSDYYTWTEGQGTPSDTPGNHTVTAVAKPGYHLTGTTTFQVHVPAQGEGLDCRGIVSPAAPTVVQSVCTGPGTQSQPSVTVAATPEGVSYVYDAGSHTVTATAGQSQKFATELPAGWTRVSDSSATYVVTLTSAGSCLVSVAPAYATVTPPTCDTAGSVETPAQPAGSVVTRSGTTPGDVRFDYEPAAGYVFAADTVTTKTVTVMGKKSGADCGEVLGTGGSRKPPVIAGVSNGRGGSPVPSAVDAGLAGGPGDARGPVGQLLLGGGLLLLVVSAWSGLGIRRRGVAQA